MKHLEILEYVPFARSKVVLISVTRNAIYELSHELPSDLRLKILRNWKILGKITKMAEGRWQHPVSLPQRKKMALVVKNYAKVEFKAFLSLFH